MTSDADRKPALGTGKKARGRPIGARDAAYAERRREILRVLTERLGTPGAMHASFRELAAGAGVSLATLQHYFQSRTPLVSAILEQALTDAAPFLAHVREPAGPFAESVREAVGWVDLGLREFGVARLYALGLAEGLGDGVLGPDFVRCVLDPSLEAVAARLAAHQARGEMRPEPNALDAATMLISPLLIVTLHQSELGGIAIRPVDRASFIDGLVSSFVRAHAVDAPSA